MENPKKLGTWDIQDEDKQSKNTTKMVTKIEKNTISPQTIEV